MTACASPMRGSNLMALPAASRALATASLRVKLPADPGTSSTSAKPDQAGA